MKRIASGYMKFKAVWRSKLHLNPLLRWQASAICWMGYRRYWETQSRHFQWWDQAKICFWSVAWAPCGQKLWCSKQRRSGSWGINSRRCRYWYYLVHHGICDILYLNTQRCLKAISRRTTTSVTREQRPTRMGKHSAASIFGEHFIVALVGSFFRLNRAGGYCPRNFAPVAPFSRVIPSGSSASRGSVWSTLSTWRGELQNQVT